MPDVTHVCLVAALPAEARPLITHFGLARDMRSKAFAVYSADAVHLIVSGAGKVAAAAACGWLYAWLEAPVSTVWLNVGIAGHSALDRGKPLLAHRITDHATGRQWFPPQIIDRPCGSSNLLTVDTPCEDYPVDSACDMEASAFVATASRFCTAELVQCLKVVSDNQQHGTHNINAGMVEDLITAHVDTVEQLCEALTALAGQIQGGRLDEQTTRRFLAAHHYTVSQQHQLRKLLQRLQTLGIDTDVSGYSPARYHTARDVIHALEQRLSHLHPTPSP